MCVSVVVATYSTRLVVAAIIHKQKIQNETVIFSLWTEQFFEFRADWEQWAESGGDQTYERNWTSDMIINKTPKKSGQFALNVKTNIFRSYSQPSSIEQLGLSWHMELETNSFTVAPNASNPPTKNGFTQHFTDFCCCFLPRCSNWTRMISFFIHCAFHPKLRRGIFYCCCFFVDL